MSFANGAVNVGQWLAALGPNAVVDIFAHATTVVHTAAELFRRAGNDARREFTEAVISKLPDIIPLEASLEASRVIIDRVSTSVNTGRVGQLLGQVTDSALVLVDDALRRATPRVLLEAVGNITVTILLAIINSFGELPIIRNGILSNGINGPTLELVWRQRVELVTFIVDLVECAKGLVNADGSGSVNALEQPYNELDITQAMNRHGMICQLQRLVKSLVTIFQTSMKVQNLASIDMTSNTTLESDLLPTPLVPLTHHIQVAPPALPGVTPIVDEDWFFVNGIGGEHHWLDLACKKLADAYGRQVVGIFNRGDGLLWDLVECAGQRTDREAGSSTSQDSLIQATMSSVAAQEALYARLKSTLEPPSTKPVVMVAHSQGCLVLRLALQQLITDGGQGMIDKMQKRLYVFTFGNPSINWIFEHSGQPSEPDDLFRRTEHFANGTDFVAGLGVLKPPVATDAGAAVVSNGYPANVVYVNNRWKGHLFGAQYSLNPDDYTGAEPSWLLLCTPGRAMGPPP
ncbi:hypothetical protein OQA88_13677 [Cercophora sp. LCS_1]